MSKSPDKKIYTIAWFKNNPDVLKKLLRNASLKTHNKKLKYKYNCVEIKENITITTKIKMNFFIFSVLNGNCVYFIGENQLYRH